MSEYELGQRVVMTGTARKEHQFQSPHWWVTVWGEGPLPRNHVGHLRKDRKDRVYTEGIIVGKRTVMDGRCHTSREESGGFTPIHGTERTVYLVAFDIRLNPVKCFIDQLRPA